MLGEGLARARAAIGYSQEAVAGALGITRTLLSYWETGRGGRTSDSSRPWPASTGSRSASS
ncbi:MAG: hypothetical protein KatS3mg014_2721 [Actinomycetota bacterium]|nr:MAG: hypothetical protein KatS3mg014_2721 [Actinomycetota bacterium]